MVRGHGALFLAAAILAAAGVPGASATTRYVKASAAGANTGTNWTNAYPSLKSALAAAVACDQIWVAAGSYAPTTGSDRTISFNLITGVAVYGGFPGVAGQEGNFNVRNYATNVTTLTGSIAGARSYHVVYGNAVDATAILDGFVVTLGSAGGVPAGHLNVGGGLLNIAASPTVRNCAFVNNFCVTGGGMCNLSDDATNTIGSNPLIVNCVFAGNTASNFGGGMYNESSRPTAINCTIFGNQATNSFGSGGGVGNSGGSAGVYPTFTNCIIWGNTAPAGPQIDNNVSSPAVTYTCVQGGYTGTGNISSDPTFVSTSDLHLQAASLCIDAGRTAALPPGTTLDLSSRQRVMGAAVDMGAYEVIPAIPFDFDHDGDVDEADFAVFKGCASGERVPHVNTPQCNQSDADSDNDVDMNDFAVFQRCYSGANKAARPNCGLNG